MFLSPVMLCVLSSVDSALGKGAAYQQGTPQTTTLTVNSVVQNTTFYISDSGWIGINCSINITTPSPLVDRVEQLQLKTK